MDPRRHLVSAVAFAAVAAAGAAAAQSLPLEMERARALLLEGAPPIAGFSAQAPVLEDGWRLVTFYAPSDDDGPVMAGVSPRRFVARRAVVGPTGVEVQWTAEERCPTLRGVLGWMSELSAPTVFVSGIDARFPPAAGQRPHPCRELSALGPRIRAGWKSGGGRDGGLRRRAGRLGCGGGAQPRPLLGVRAAVGGRPIVVLRQVGPA
jgi:hypothetical protein